MSPPPEGRYTVWAAGKLLVDRPGGEVAAQAEAQRIANERGQPVTLERYNEHRRLHLIEVAPNGPPPVEPPGPAPKPRAARPEPPKPPEPRHVSDEELHEYLFGEP